jgi:hypothetical protein
VQKELNVTIKCDGETVTAEILEPESGDSVTIEEPYTPDERNPEWRERLSNEIYSWVELGMEEDK